MNRMTNTVAAVVLVALAAAAWGAEPASDYERLKPLEWMIGDWVGEYVAPFDMAPTKKGERGVALVSRRWGVDKTCMLLDAQLVSDGKRTFINHEVAAWDPGRDRLVNWGFGTPGVTDGTFTQVGEKVVLTWSAEGKEGKFQGTSILEKIDAASYTWEARQLIRNGEKLPDWPKITYRRKTGVPAGELWQAYREASAGTWLGEGTIRRDFGNLPIAQGDKFTARFTLKPDMDGRAAIGGADFQLLGKPFTAKSRALAGWDPDSQQVRFTAFWSGDLVEEIVLTGRSGSSFLGTYTAKLPGTATTRAGISMDFPDKDSYVITYLDGPDKGQVLSSWTRAK